MLVRSHGACICADEVQTKTAAHLVLSMLPQCSVVRADLRTFLQSRQEIYAIAPIGVGQRKLKVHPGIKHTPGLHV